MEKHAEKRTLDTYIGKVEIHYNPAPLSFIDSQTSYTAALMVENKPTCAATGLTRETALFNLFREYAKFQVPEII